MTEYTPRHHQRAVVVTDHDGRVDWFGVLGLPTNAQPHEITARARRLAHMVNDSSDITNKEEVFKLLDRAEQLLTDPVARAKVQAQSALLFMTPNKAERPFDPEAMLRSAIPEAIQRLENKHMHAALTRPEKLREFFRNVIDDRLRMKSDPALQAWISQSRGVFTGVRGPCMKDGGVTRAINALQRNCDSTVNQIASTLRTLDRSATIGLPENRELIAHVVAFTAIRQSVPGLERIMQGEIDPLVATLVAVMNNMTPQRQTEFDSQVDSRLTRLEQLHRQATNSPSAASTARAAVSQTCLTAFLNGVTTGEIANALDAYLDEPEIAQSSNPGHTLNMLFRQQIGMLQVTEGDLALELNNVATSTNVGFS